MIVLFLKLLLAHFLGDFVFQPQKWVIDKEQKKITSSKLYLHIGVHALLLLFLLGFDTKYISGFFIIITSHFLIDIAKIYIQKEKTKRTLFFIDQVLHILILGIVTNMYSPFSIDIEYVLSEKSLLLFSCLIFVTFVSSVMISIIITKWNPEEDRNTNNSLANAGKYIGVLERLFIFVFILSNHWEGVGFLIAAKSVFRFSNLSEAKDRKLTEYMLIGTLLSFGLAIFTGLVYLHFIQ